MVLEFIERKGSPELLEWVPQNVIELLSTLDPRSRKLFENLIFSPSFEFATIKMKKFDRINHTVYEELDFCGNLAGYFHERISYEYASNVLYPEKIVVSPQDTTEVFGIILGKKQQKCHGGLQVAIPGSTIPDGLVFNHTINGTTELLEILEYKTGGVLCDESLDYKFRKREAWVRQNLQTLMNPFYKRSLKAARWLVRNSDLSPELYTQQEKVKITYLIPSTNNKVITGKNTSLEILPYSYRDIWTFTLLVRIHSKFSSM